MLYGSFSLAIYLTHGSVYKSVLISPFIPPSPSPWRRKWQPTPWFLLAISHQQRILAGYSPWGWQRVRHDLTTEHFFSYRVCVSVFYVCLYANRFICMIFLSSTSMCYSIFIFVSPSRSIRKTLKALSSHPLSLCGHSDLPHTAHPKWTHVFLCHRELLCIIWMSPKFYSHSTRGRIYFTALQPDTYSFLLEYNCFTMFCYFLPYGEVNQPYVYIYPLPLRTPSHSRPSL